MLVADEIVARLKVLIVVQVVSALDTFAVQCQCSAVRSTVRYGMVGYLIPYGIANYLVGS
jgi:hypothetical protein